MTFFDFFVENVHVSMPTGMLYAFAFACIRPDWSVALRTKHILNIYTWCAYHSKTWTPYHR